MGSKTHAEWSIADDDLDAAMGPTTAHDLENGAGDLQLLDDPADMGKSFEEPRTEPTRDRQVKPNKVYIGGLPDHTRPEDLQNCFGKIGNIVAIELKLGYGFVEFDSREAAEESVARYHEGYFMGNKIRVEPSHGRGRSYRRSDEPGACFRCGESGHWARECPRPSTQSRGAPYDQPSHERGYSNREHHSSKEAHSYREEYSSSGPTRSRGERYHDTPQAAAPPARERDRRDQGRDRDYDDYRTRNSSPPPQVSRHERTRHHGSQRENPSNGQPSERDPYDQYNNTSRRHQAEDRSAQYTMHSGRPRTPPGPPPSWRDEAPRGHHQTQETRRRAQTPPPYTGNGANGSRRALSRRRSLSPAPRYDSRYGRQTHDESERYSGHARVRDYHRGSRAEDSGHRRS